MTEPTPQDENAASPAPVEGRFARLYEAIGDRLNPILVKETRQALKSRQFTMWFVMLLIACWITTIGAIAYIGPSIYYVSAGGYFLFAYYVILALPLVVVVPFSAYRSLSSEHEENTRDLLEVSSLTPRQVINGKLGSALLQIAVYLSALAPCLAFTYLLRGVELYAIVLLLAYAVLASIGLSAVGLVVAATSRQKYAQVVMSVTLAGGLFSAFSGLLGVASIVLSLDSRDLQNAEFRWFNLAVLSLYVTTLAIVYSAAIAMTTFTSANRSTTLRIATFVQQTVFVAWIAGTVAAGFPRQTLFSAFVVAAVYWFTAGALMTGESPSLSLRVRRSLPQSLLGRAIGSWFNPGSGSGYVFASTNLFMLATLAAWAAFSVVKRGNYSPYQTALSILLLTAYVVAYLGIGRMAVHGLRRVAKVTSLGGFLVQVLIALGGSSLPFVIQTLSDGLRLSDLTMLTILSPAWNVPRMVDGQISTDLETPLLIAVGAVALAIFVVNLAIAGREARQLRVATPRRVLEDDIEQSPKAELTTNPWGDRPEPEAVSEAGA